MYRKLLLVLVAAVFLLSFALTGCQGGIAQELYDRVAAQVEEAQAELAEVQTNLANLGAEKAAAEAALDDAQDRVAELVTQVESLKEQYELTGATPAETAEKIVKYYHDTHVYSTWDLFTCSDMAGEVWNMLKAQGINAVIAVGNIDNPISDILQSNHAWVLAEVAPGEYLALETTGGYVVPESENPLYYRGWTFDSPEGEKDYQKLVREYNTRVSIRNELAAEEREVVEEHNQSTDQQEADKLLAVRDKLAELILQHESVLNSIKAEINSLATECGG